MRIKTRARTRDGRSSRRTSPLAQSPLAQVAQVRAPVPRRRSPDPGPGTGGPDADRLHVLVYAFYCSPFRGSEHAAGWGVVQALKEVADLTVLVQESNVQHVREWEHDHPGERLGPGVTFVPVAKPARGRWVQEHVPLLENTVWRARYLGWLQEARRVAERVAAQRPFDVAIQASPGTYWLPSTVVDLGVPSVYGPAGGAARSSPRLWRYLGVRGLLGELGEQAFVQVAARTPWVRRTWRRADVRLVETEHALRQLPAELRSGTSIVNRAILVRVPPDPPVTPRRPYLVFPSQLEPRKGPRLALRALAHTPPHVRLAFLNEGPEEPVLRRLARRWGVADRVEFRGKVPRDELFTAWAEAAASVHTGLREEGGAALAEAMLAGVPVIVLGHGGARVVAEATTDPGRAVIVDVDGAERTARRLGRAMTRLVDASESAPATSARDGYLDQRSTREALRDAVRRAARTAATLRSA